MHMATITKAIIPVAGWGTRRLPITKAVEKCMIPIGNRPIIDYVVRDCVKAGIKEIVFVVSRGSNQLQQYYSDNAELNQFLELNGKQDLRELARPPHDVAFSYIEQDGNQKYGTAVPVALVYPHLKKGESVAVIMGDDFVYNGDGSSEIARLIQATPEGGNGMLSTSVPRENVGQYGVIGFDPETGMFAGIVEKPTPEQAPSDQINISKYIFNYDMLTRIYEYCRIDVSGEYGIVEPMTQAVYDKVDVTVVPVQGEYLDCGNVHGWLYANNLIVGNH